MTLGKIMNEDLNCDIGIVVALEEELDQILPGIQYETLWDDEKEEYFYFFPLGLGSRSYQCVAILIGGMGPEKAALSSERLISQYHPTTVVNIGIAGSLTEHVYICDVVIGSQIDGYHQDSKISQTGDGNIKLIPSREVLPTSTKLQKHAKNFKFAYRKEMSSWKSESHSRWIKNVLEEDRVYLGTVGINVEDVNLHVGHVASGPSVIASDIFAKHLGTLDRKYLAAEMESYGFMQSAFDKVDSTLVIRGISDFCDGRKKLLDEIGSGSIRSAAMQNAFAFLSILADLCLFNYSENSPKRTKFQLVLDVVLFDKNDCKLILDELTKLNVDDMTIQVHKITEGSMVIDASCSKATSERLSSLIGLNALEEIKGCRIKSFDSKLGSDIDIAVKEGKEALGEVNIDDYENSLSELSMTYFNNSDFNIARVLLEKLLYMQSLHNELSLEGIDTLTNLAQAYRRIGDFAEAKRLIDYAIQQYEIINNRNHITIPLLIARNNRVELLIALGRPYDALLEAKDVLAKQIDILDDNHTQVLRTKNNLAEALRHIGRVEEALELHYSNLKIRLQSTDIKDSDTNVSAWNLLLCYVDLGYVQEVKALLDQLSWLVNTDIHELSIDQRFLRERIIEYMQVSNLHSKKT